MPFLKPLDSRLYGGTQMPSTKMISSVQSRKLVLVANQTAKRQREKHKVWALEEAENEKLHQIKRKMRGN